MHHVLPLLVLPEDVGVDCGQSDGEHAHGQKRALCCRSSLIVLLNLVLHAPREERAAHDEEEVAEDGPEQGALNDDDLAVSEPRDAQQHLDHIAKGCIQQTSRGLAELCGDVLGCLPDEPGQRDDRDEVEEEDPLRLPLSVLRDDAYGQRQEHGGEDLVIAEDGAEALQVTLRLLLLSPVLRHRRVHLAGHLAAELRVRAAQLVLRLHQRRHRAGIHGRGGEPLVGVSLRRRLEPMRTRALVSRSPASICTGA
mmetsp:Transcript_4786/g.14026  ORF Transcript_4786/g.14026 Transcript_4786/m.14026 type:complete len:253 (-) Transcript_4786:3-761(-)